MREMRIFIPLTRFIFAIFSVNIKNHAKIAWFFVSFDTRNENSPLLLQSFDIFFNSSFKSFFINDFNFYREIILVYLLSL